MKRIVRIIAHFSQIILFILGWLLFSIFLRLKIKGLHNLEKVKGPIIFSGNHTAQIDVWLVPLGTFLKGKFPVFMVSLPKKEYLGLGWYAKYFYGGTLFSLFGGYPTYRGLQNYERSLRNQISLLEKGYNLCMFPEGGLTPDGELQQGKPGIAYLAYRTNATVIPFAIMGHFGMTFKSFFSRKHKVNVVFGNPLKLNSINNFEISGDKELSEDEKTILKDSTKMLMDKIKNLIDNNK